MQQQIIDLYECNPIKNTECKKSNCKIYGGPCHETTVEEFKMQNEMRYYLEQIKACMEGEDAFVAQYIVTAVKLPTGAVELAINDKFIKEKIEYILEAYDEDMKLKTNPEIEMQQVMIV